MVFLSLAKLKLMVYNYFLVICFLMEKKEQTLHQYPRSATDNICTESLKLHCQDSWVHYDIWKNCLQRCYSSVAKID